MTHNSSPPPPRPGLIRRLFRGYRAGRLIVLLIALAAGLGTILNNSTNSSQSTSSTDDPVAITLTWDEWTDLQNCIFYTQINITNTLYYDADLLDPETITQAITTYDRLDHLVGKVQRAGPESTADIHPTFLEPILEHQTQRMAEFNTLMLTLYQAQINNLLGIQEHNKKKPPP